MRLSAALLSMAALVAVAPLARAQETDEQIKKRILDKVRERLDQEKKTILERMSKVIDEEFSGTRKEPVAPKATDKRIRDLERKLQALDDQRDDLQRDIRGIKRETEDKKIIQDAKNSPPEAGRETKTEFDAAFDTHNEATKALAADKAGAAKGFEKSIAGFKRLYYALQDVPEERGHMVASAYNVACGYALVGNSTEALDWLETSIKAGYNDWDHIREDSDFNSIRKERRYLRLMADR